MIRNVNLFVLIFMVDLIVDLVLDAPINDGNKICSEIPEMILEEILGAAYNARYMSIDIPANGDENGSKRGIGRDLEFYVDSGFREDVREEPAWNIVNHVEATLRVFGDTRYRRDADYLQEWHCKSRIKWTDLGANYFPRYLRSVECVDSSCWFNIYRCKPRSFTVKILKRKRDRCVKAEPGTRIGVTGLPRDLKELWVWEERAVSFCCDCSN